MTFPLPQKDSAGKKIFQHYLRLQLFQNLTNPQIALKLDVVISHGHFLRLEDRLLDVGRCFLEVEAELLDGFVDCHSSNEGGQIPHVLGAVFDVGLLVADKLEEKRRD